MEKCLSRNIWSDTMERGFDIMKILLLEDDIELCNAIQDELQKARYMVDCCHDGDNYKGDAPQRNYNPCHYHHGDVRTK